MSDRTRSAPVLAGFASLSSIFHVTAQEAPCHFLGLSYSFHFTGKLARSLPLYKSIQAPAFEAILEHFTSFSTWSDVHNWKQSMADFSVDLNSVGESSDMLAASSHNLVLEPNSTMRHRLCSVRRSEDSRWKIVYHSSLCYSRIWHAQYCTCSPESSLARRSRLRDNLLMPITKPIGIRK